MGGYGVFELEVGLAEAWGCFVAGVEGRGAAEEDGQDRVPCEEAVLLAGEYTKHLWGRKDIPGSNAKQPSENSWPAGLDPALLLRAT